MLRKHTRDFICYLSRENSGMMGGEKGGGWYGVLRVWVAKMLRIIGL